MRKQVSKHGDKPEGGRGGGGGRERGIRKEEQRFGGEEKDVKKLRKWE